VIGLALALHLLAVPVPRPFVDRYGAALVDVDVDGSGAAVPVQGFFVSSSGVLCTVLRGAAVGDRVDVDGRAAAGVVGAVDEDGLALVVVADAVDVTAVAVADKARPTRWLMGLYRDEKGRPAGTVGGVDVGWRLLLPLPKGAPVLDEAGKVVAVVVRARGGGVVDAVPVDRVRALAARLHL
jgi:hypothetical protein